MNEESSQFEQYCSAYYDKHGLYNDGFPCPSDKYCCLNNEGMKYCCLKNSQPVKSPVGNPQTAFNLYTTLSNSIKYNKLNDDPSQNSYIPRQKQANPANDLTSQAFSDATSLFISNSTVLIASCVALSIVILVLIVIYFCACRHCKQAKRSTLKPRIHSAVTSSTCTSSLTTPNVDHTNLLVDEMNNDCKTLMIDANQQYNVQRANYASAGSGVNTSNFLLNMSTGASSSSTTQTPLITTNMHQTQNHKNLFDFKERDILSNDGDFIMFTSNNLDFLKAHSAFNSTQLNYYPTLSSLKLPNDEHASIYAPDMQKMSTTHMNDFRFSTFLPSQHYAKHDLL